MKFRTLVCGCFLRFVNYLKSRRYRKQTNKAKHLIRLYYNKFGQIYDIVSDVYGKTKTKKSLKTKNNLK